MSICNSQYKFHLHILLVIIIFLFIKQSLMRGLDSAHLCNEQSTITVTKTVFMFGQVGSGLQFHQT